jgi:predicted esterase
MRRFLKVFWVVTGVLVSACSGESSDSADSAVSDSGIENETGSPIVVDLPDYSNGNCPELVEGMNKGFRVGENKRKFRVSLPENPKGAPVIFLWHWLGGSSLQAMNYLNFEGVSGAENAILVAPQTDGYSYEWRFDKPSAANPDLLFFDDMLRCLYEEYQIDLDRVYATGMSAGGLWSSSLIVHRSERFAAIAPLSGGALEPAYQTPVDAIPVLLFWGGESDTYAGFSFDTANELFSGFLQDDGHFVAECDHGEGHTFPPEVFPAMWSFFESHPKGVEPEPYASGLPASFPDYCSVP